MFWKRNSFLLVFSNIMSMYFEENSSNSFECISKLWMVSAYKEKMLCFLFCVLILGPLLRPLLPWPWFWCKDKWVKKVCEFIIIIIDLFVSVISLWKWRLSLQWQQWHWKTCICFLFTFISRQINNTLKGTTYTISFYYYFFLFCQ